MTPSSLSPHYAAQSPSGHNNRVHPNYPISSLRRVCERTRETYHKVAGSSVFDYQATPSVPESFEQGFHEESAVNSTSSPSSTQ
ncbi:hypothetical protein J3Q64DRAFT_1830547 [Phycomyces blakesleeanus]|uniref:Uncharacterized protein n=3 Tax=Phycomyces blakesleeanus TaxID=4837 RepID=A0A167NHV8_PHYB8|nr:hypothetical protein PHYBLDRAFT_142922 [Phycomyces blakesleeanus NRRL 1555(-)]XP_018294732.1 hypothetical protein PHYBLDRAFT_142207 [Phycomyces blakesleeanus NRRL 1555(-)]OAD75938.1 hypothetical protein PHYBLDRAFT_142922 [Phycomyces blakesleeanus NRRL 1555(-)]OAD76692.1 hypothetical protein PHYBLDRAFT_142207 [Phycomyces blakesleeanus NRRL 1555(-)]|eukprot:XP_018293978.1 hypothetical protein PHYBLDRAFT_142922 [Phycomyces blakesleeanus NRRL 1555(-)]